MAAEQSHAARSADRDAAKPEQERVTTVASQDPETTGAIGADASEDLNCAQSRKRLWVDGEGWIVRKVTTCY